MKLGNAGALGHLTYCTNIHAAESWPDTLAALQQHLPRIKEQVSPDQAMGLGLRLSALAAEALNDHGQNETFIEFLDRLDCYVFTINGFPYGAFHGQPVKEQVYAPDWSKQERLDYTNLLADHLIRLLPDGMDGSISTVPGTYKPWANDKKISLITENILQHVAHLWRIVQASGKTIVLALEPEPCCLIETIEETVRFFSQQLYSDIAASRISELTGLSVGDSHAVLRRHLGVCYDVCHAAVEYEDPEESIANLQRAGIPIAKVQLSSALKIAKVGAATTEQLEPFCEPTYLHQVVARDGERLTRFNDLPEALARAGASIGHEWRCHFHIPVFLAEMEAFSTTQDFLREVLAIHRQSPISQHLEVETYTWDVLPAAYRDADVATAISRELDWVKRQLAQ